MYRLIQSPDIRELAGALAEQLSDHQPADPLAAAEVIVPNRDTGRWLFLYLAESSGIAANIRFQLPSEWLWERKRELVPGLPDVLPSDPGPMTWSIYSLLKNEDVLKELPELGFRLLEGGKSTNHLYLWQLSRQISSVFDQYQVYRPGMLHEWERGKT
ncbi:MAG: exodeoxyribonuclease V subunit gamma, partial [Balneolaceae bacterium]